ncbi:hypothetical protein FIBSPDRAFT_992785 [Athelia psychrophila]|uniref:Uncharacterized protein n=1 Tax=Athelia psychrophila TaxID=1759441 RepID=A0A165YGZ5_9AGAM|nr:hypothetical protein FIBSPDRAFT_762138 [Fibularhizoctonia sp. CBS 109695]KZP09548.1 hypothetical protein FIBSPDRAFT_992785 [Fibularhizoctonia sp. CBS 109695]
MWDWTLTLGEEFRIAKRCGPTLAVLAYFLARTSAVAVCVLCVIFFVRPPPDSCAALFSGIGFMTMTGAAAKAYLFLLRVRAVYDNSTLVKSISGVAFLAVVCARITIAYMVRSSPQEQTGRCAVTDVGPLPKFSLWLTVAYDTCIFLSISVRLTSHAKSITTPWIPSFVRGHGLPHTMRHVLQDGQIYYCITIFFSLLAAVLAVAPVGPIYQAAFTLPGFVMEVTMACRVFHAMILRSLDRAQTVDVNLPTAQAGARTTAMSLFELDTVLEHRIRTMNIDDEKYTSDTSTEH